MHVDSRKGVLRPRLVVSRDEVWVIDQVNKFKSLVGKQFLQYGTFPAIPWA